MFIFPISFSPAKNINSTSNRFLKKIIQIKRVLQQKRQILHSKASYQGKTRKIQPILPKNDPAKRIFSESRTFSLLLDKKLNKKLDFIFNCNIIINEGCNLPLWMKIFFKFLYKL